MKTRIECNANDLQTKNPLKEVHTSPVIITEVKYGTFFITKKIVEIGKDGARKTLSEERY